MQAMLTYYRERLEQLKSNVQDVLIQARLQKIDIEKAFELLNQYEQEVEEIHDCLAVLNSIY